VPPEHSPSVTVDEEPIIDPAWLRRKAAQCMDLARVSIVPEVINGLAALASPQDTASIADGSPISPCGGVAHARSRLRPLARRNRTGTRGGKGWRMDWVRVDRAIVTATLMFGVAAAALVTAIADPGRPMAAAAIYSAGLISCSLASFLYHTRTASSRRPFLRRLDHAAIFLLIAGTYTPVGLVALHDHAGEWLVGAVWGLALIGAGLKLVLGPGRENIFVPFYLAVGWTALVDVGAILRALNGVTVGLIAIGGLSFSVGAIVHWRVTRPWAQPIWHTLVLLGCATHCAAVIAII
jgi:hemolysin III